MPQPSAFFLRSSLRTSCALQDAQQPTSQSDAAEEAPLPHSSYNLKKLRYANSIARTELLSHEGDVAVRVRSRATVGRGWLPASRYGCRK